MNKPVLGPSKLLENTFRVINEGFSYCGIKYWLCFGGLWGMIKNNGVIPDGDLDICTYYGMDYNRIERALRGLPGGYVITKVLKSDKDDLALYCSIGSTQGYPHICLTFWYLHEGIRYYCHDQHHEVEGIGIPKSGYWFRGIPAYAVDDDSINFRMAEWPGIQQATKVRVPRQAGVVLDHLYPDWAYSVQRYELKTGAPLKMDKIASYHKGGAVSPYAVHVGSMKDFGNKALINNELEDAKRKYFIRLKTGK